MLFECAIAPEAIYAASRPRRDFRDFIREFSIGQPNVISDYPKFKKGVIGRARRFLGRYGPLVAIE